MIDSLDIIVRDQVAHLDARLARDEITDQQHTTALRHMIEAMS